MELEQKYNKYLTIYNSIFPNTLSKYYTESRSFYIDTIHFFILSFLYLIASIFITKYFLIGLLILIILAITSYLKYQDKLYQVFRENYNIQSGQINFRNWHMYNIVKNNKYFKNKNIIKKIEEDYNC